MRKLGLFLRELRAVARSGGTAVMNKKNAAIRFGELISFEYYGCLWLRHDAVDPCEYLATVMVCKLRAKFPRHSIQQFRHASSGSF